MTSAGTGVDQPWVPYADSPAGHDYAALIEDRQQPAATRAGQRG